MRTRRARMIPVRCSGSRLFKDRGEKYWEWRSVRCSPFILPAAGQAGGTGPALDDSAAAGMGQLGPSVLIAWPRAEPKDFRYATVHLGCISLVRTLEISGPSTQTIL